MVLEYRMLMAALHDFEDALAAQTITQPEISGARARHLGRLQAEPAHAALGALATPLAWFATVGGTEADLVADVAALWTRGLALYDALGRFRLSLQAVLDQPGAPDPASLAELNDAGNALRLLAPQVQSLLADLDKIRTRVASHDHLPPHPRQEDRPIEDWNASDLLLARRTDALVRTLLSRAGTPRTEAFALGACAAYGAQASGSMYLGQVVGGPRRAHRIRDRLGRNAIGAWIAGARPDVPTFAALADLLEGAMPAGIDVEAATLLSEALAEVLPGGIPPVPLDAGTGFTRMIAHLRALAVIRTPAPPAPLSDALAATLFGDPAAPFTPTLEDQSALTQSGGTPGVAGSGGGVQILSAGDDGPTHQEEPDSTEVKCGAFWEALGLSLLFVLGGWFACVLRWAGGDRCPLWDDAGANWAAAFDNGVYVGGEVDTDWGSQMLTAGDAAALAQRPEVIQLAGDLFTAQSSLWEGFERAAEFLALHGVIYPDGFLGRHRYRQFTAIPRTEQGLWPRQAFDGPRFDLYPDTEVEEPAGLAPFVPGTPPSAILSGIGGGGQLSAPAISVPLWADAVAAIDPVVNLDLDADRGWRHECWQTGGSIADQPVDAQILGYDDV
ncbi:hypothetical protein AB2L57_04080 [Microbacterium sp. HA-8]|uniref:hypothetical protein n=1 Tax=Microbacterium sp. HA-8 TaxID=3234200 RepID=UPI0038F7754C